MISKRFFWLTLGILMITFSFWAIKQVSASQAQPHLTSPANESPVIGLPFTISTDVIDEIVPAVVYNTIDQEFLVVWQNSRSVTDDIYAQRISEQGKLLSSFFVGEGNNPRVAHNPKNNSYLVVYDIWQATDYDVYARRVNFQGPLGSAFPVAFNLDETEHSPAVAYNTHPNFDEFLVVWENIPPPPLIINRVEGQRVAGTAGNGDGGSETIGGRLSIAVNSDYNAEPDIAYNLNMNEYLVVYTRLPGGGGNYDIYARRVTGDGVLLTETVIDSSGNDQGSPAVAAYRLNQATPYLVVFTDYWNDTNGDVRGYLVNQQGQSMQLINIAQTPGEPEYDPAISHSENWDGYFISWTQGPMTDHDIFSRKVSHTGVPGPEFDLTDDGSIPKVCDRALSAIAAGSTSGLAVWQDPCGCAGGMDIVGRLIGYQVHLPLAVR